MKTLLLAAALAAAPLASASAAPWWMLNIAGECVSAADQTTMESPARAYETVKTLSLGFVEPTIEEKKDGLGNDAVLLKAAGALTAIYYKSEAPCRAAAKAIKDTDAANAEAEQRKLDKYR